MLEGKITEENHNRLLEIGFVDKVKSWLGGAADIGNANVGKIFKSGVAMRQLDAAKKDVLKAVQDLRNLVINAGVEDDDNVVEELLLGILKDANINAAELAKLNTSMQSGSQSDKSEKQASGKPVDTSKPEVDVPMIAAAAAQAAGQDVEKAQEQATEKNVDVPKATQVLSKAISASSKVNVEKVAKIIDFLIQNKHMLAESSYLKSANLISAAKEASLKANQSLVVERWISLAGIRLIKEEAAPKVEDKKKKQFSDVLEDIRSKFNPDELTDDDILNVLIALDGLDSISIK